MADIKKEQDALFSNIYKSDDSYRDWIANVSKRFRQSQLKAAVKVNDEMLRFYWSLGRDMEYQKEAYAWGSHFYQTISEDLKKEMPDVKSFSPRNLLYMHQFYKLFPNTAIAKQPVSQNKVPDEVFKIPWGHIVQIINKVGGDSKKALFYVQKTIENNWSRAVLLNFLDTNLYERHGKAVTNFAQTLPLPQSYRKGAGGEK